MKAESSTSTFYYPMQYPFSVDKDDDETNDQQPSGFFTSLVNYLPVGQIIQSRKGITTFSHTPDTSGTVWNPETYTDCAEVTPTPFFGADFAVIQAILPFNATASMGVNLLNTKTIATAMYDISLSSNCDVYTLEKKEGAGCIIMTNDTAVNSAGQGGTRGMRFITNPWGTWMPGHSAGLTNKFLITYWVYPFTDVGNAMWHFTFGNSGDPAVLAFGIRQFNQNLQSYWQDSAGNTISQDTISNSVYANEWNFIAAWCDIDTNYQGLYLKNDTVGEIYTANENIITGGHFYTHSSTNTINAKFTWTGDGYVCDASDAYHGLMDYVTMWSRPMHLNNTSNITLVRLIQGLAWA